LKKLIIAVSLASLVLLACTSSQDTGHYADNVKLITKEELKALLDSPELTIIDVRTEKQWRASSTKIAGAERENPVDFAVWADKYPKERRIILYCA
jgi:rhodanese-related sulfurtransferase